MNKSFGIHDYGLATHWLPTWGPNSIRVRLVCMIVAVLIFLYSNKFYLYGIFSYDFCILFSKYNFYDANLLHQRV